MYLPIKYIQYRKTEAFELNTYICCSRLVIWRQSATNNYITKLDFYKHCKINQSFCSSYLFIECNTVFP